MTESESKLQMPAVLGIVFESENDFLIQAVGVQILGLHLPTRLLNHFQGAKGPLSYGYPWSLLYQGHLLP
jgi:hypothetical protein